MISVKRQIVILFTYINIILINVNISNCSINNTNEEDAYTSDVRLDSKNNPRGVLTYISTFDVLYMVPEKVRIFYQKAIFYVTC